MKWRSALAIMLLFASSEATNDAERALETAKANFQHLDFYDQQEYLEYARAQVDKNSTVLRRSLKHSSQPNTLTRALPFPGKGFSQCWHAVNIRPIEAEATIDEYGVQRVRLPTALQNTVSETINKYKRMADTWLVPPANASSQDELNAIKDTMQQTFTEIYEKAKARIVAAATTATSGFLRAGDFDGRVDEAWALKTGRSTMRLMLCPAEFVKCVLRVADSPQFADVPTPVTGKVLNEFIKNTKILNGDGHLRSKQEADTRAVDFVHIDASRGVFSADFGTGFLKEALQVINVERDQKELMTDYLTGMLDMTNFWMSPKPDAKPMCFMRHQQGPDGIPTYSGSPCEPSCPYCHRAEKPKHEVPEGQCGLGVGYNEQQDWMYFPNLSLEDGWAAAFPTMTSCHSAFDGDWSDPYMQQRCSCELRVLSLVVDMEDKKSVSRAAALLAEIPSPTDHGEAPMAFGSTTDATEFLYRKWCKLNSTE